MTAAGRRRTIGATPAFTPGVRARARRPPRAARHRYGERRPEYDRGPPPDDRRRDYERRDYLDDDRQRDYHYR